MITHVLPAMDLALHFVVLDAQGRLKTAQVVNGNWTLRRDGETWRMENEYGNLVNSRPVKPGDDELWPVPAEVAGAYSEALEWARNQPRPVIFDPARVRIERDRRSTTQGEFTIFYNDRRISNFHDPIKMTGAKHPDGSAEWAGYSDEKIIEIARDLFEKGHSYERIPPIRLQESLERIVVRKTVLLPESDVFALKALDGCPEDVIAITPSGADQSAMLVGRRSAVAIADPAGYAKFLITNDELAKRMSEAGAGRPKFWAEQLRLLSTAHGKLVQLQEQQGGELNEAQQDAKDALRTCLREMVGDLGIQVEFANDPRFSSVILMLPNGRFNRMSGGWAVEEDLERFDGLFHADFWNDMPRFFEDIGADTRPARSPGAEGMGL